MNLIETIKKHIDYRRNQKEVTADLFRRSCIPRLSPLTWRIPVFLWGLATISWSIATFWGPEQKYFLYMTHWGLLLVCLESAFSILVVVMKSPPKTLPNISIGGCVCYGIIQPLNFYVSCWQTYPLVFPLLLLRSFLFLISMTTLLTSVVTALTLDVNFGFWFLYLNHWVLLLVVLTNGFSTAVSAGVYFGKPIDATYGLPWHVRIYWVLYNITIPVAFLITVFYWCILKNSSKKARYAPNPILDVFIHGVNSIVMLLELLLSAHPSRFLHIVHPLFFAGVYMLFTVVYYCVGGRDPWGNHFIYPVIDWSTPLKTAAVISLTALFIGLMHLVVVAVAAVRDYITSRCLKPTPAPISERNPFEAICQTL